MKINQRKQSIYTQVSYILVCLEFNDIYVFIIVSVFVCYPESDEEISNVLKFRVSDERGYRLAVATM